jgi:4-amino-4-deoxy-L-arabinose transferase-like glycosyltransferase
VEPNPDAISWYVEEAQRLLEEQQRRAESLRTRGGQVAGFGAAVLALIGGNAGAVMGAVGDSARVAVGVTLLAAAVCVAAAIAVASWGVLKPRSFGVVAADEIAIYASNRFLTEPDLWRVQMRALRALEEVTRETQEDGNAAAGAIMISLYALLTGLGFSLISLATLIFESI